MERQSEFCCNIGVLNSDEQARHRQLTEKLLALRTATLEMADGYQFQYRPGHLSLAELADWVAAESKCCPFFDFHIDLEERGTVVCLRLTGKEGVKRFIRAEFHLDSE